jgi:hypothetical protein
MKVERPFAAHESLVGPSPTYCDVRGSVAIRGESGRDADIMPRPTLTQSRGSGGMEFAANPESREGVFGSAGALANSV